MAKQIDDGEWIELTGKQYNKNKARLDKGTLRLIASYYKFEVKVFRNVFLQCIKDFNNAKTDEEKISALSSGISEEGRWEALNDLNCIFHFYNRDTKLFKEAMKLRWQFSSLLFDYDNPNFNGEKPFWYEDYKEIE